MAKRKSNKPHKRKIYRLKGKFVNKATWEAAQKLQKQAKAERKARNKPRPGKAKDFKGKTIPTRKGKSDLDLVTPKFGSKASQARTEFQTRTIIDEEIFPSFDAVRVFPNPQNYSERIYQYQWRFEGLFGEYLASGLLRLLALYAIDSPGVRTRVVITYAIGRERQAVSSPMGFPQATLQYIQTWLERPSAQELADESDGRIWFDVYVNMRQPANDIDFVKMPVPRQSKPKTKPLKKVKRKVSRRKRKGRK